MPYWSTSSIPSGRENTAGLDSARAVCRGTFSGPYRLTIYATAVRLCSRRWSHRPLNDCIHDEKREYWTNPTLGLVSWILVAHDQVPKTEPCWTVGRSSPPLAHRSNRLPLLCGLCPKPSCECMASGMILTWVAPFFSVLCFWRIPPSPVYVCPCVVGKGSPGYVILARPRGISNPGYAFSGSTPGIIQ